LERAARRVSQGVAGKRGVRNMENRRTPRQPANWAGMYRLEGESAVEPRACEIADISKSGLGITFPHGRPSELIGRRISVEISAVGNTVNLRLKGEIKNATVVNARSAIARVGIEFAALPVIEEAMLAAVVDVMNEVLITN
jgi:hypothetical protein